MNKNQVKAYLLYISAIKEAIEATGPEGIPEGVLFANLMGSLSLASFESMIRILVESKTVTNHGHLLVAAKKKEGRDV